MKKFITAVALFAASTALANAGTVITLTDLSQGASVTTTSGGNITYTASSGYLSGSSLFTNTPDTDGTARYSASTTIILNLSALGITSESPTWMGSATNLLQYRTSADETTSAIGLQIVSSGLQYTWQDSTYSSTNFLYWSSLLAKSYQLNGATCVTLTLEGAAASSNTNGGTFVYDETGTAFKSNNTTYNYGFSALKADAAYTAIYVNTDYVSAVSVFSGVASAIEISTLSEALKTAAIPEPSAFGLLASVGALALVAARRRRCRSRAK